MMRLVLFAVLLSTIFVCAGCTDETPETPETSAAPPSTETTIFAFAETRTLAEKGDAEAQFRLGNMYAEGKAVTNDFTEAAKWFHKAAEQGQVQALYTLGVMYTGGLGVPVDYAEGYVWYCLASKSGFETAKQDCEGLAGELQAEELVVANKRIDQLFDEIQLRKQVPGPAT